MLIADSLPCGASPQVSVHLTKVLLHMEDRYGTLGFLRLRQAAMVALTVTDPVTVRPSCSLTC